MLLLMFPFLILMQSYLCDMHKRFIADIFLSFFKKKYSICGFLHHLCIFVSELRV